MLTLISPETRVPKDHPLRRIKVMADQELRRLSRVFDEMYSHTGRPSIPPERVLKSLILMALYSVRSERQFCEQLDYNLLFRWFLEMNMMQESFDPTVFTKNWERLMEHEVGRRFFDAVVGQARQEGLMSDDHFWRCGQSDGGFSWREAEQSDASIDDGSGESFDAERQRQGIETLLWGSLFDGKSQWPFGGHPDYPGYGHSGARSGRSDVGIRPRTLGADKGYDTKGFVSMLRSRKITPHVVQNTERRGGSAIDGWTTRHGGYGVSQRIRKRVEEIGGWIKVIGGFRRTRFKGELRTQLAGWFVGAAYNLLRMAKVLPQMEAG